MVPQSSLLVALVDVIEKIPSPSVEARGGSRGGRPPVYSDRLFLKALVIMLVRNVSTVSGLIAILEKLFSGQSAAAVLKFDVEDFFRRIELDQFISSQRRNGLAGMVKRIRGLATQISRQPPA